MSAPGRTPEGMERQKKVLQLISHHINDYGYPPTVRWLANELSISTSNVVYYLDWLVDDGKIERDKNVSRGIRITSDVVY